MRERGYLEAQDMAAAFNMLRANDLIWSFVVTIILLGREHIPVDLLFWNSDWTRMPAAMHSFYLRTMYHQNLLCKTRRYHVGGYADRPIESQDFDLHSGDARRPHCALEIDLCGDTLVLRTDQIRFIRCGPHGWRDQPARHQIWPLGE